MKRTRRRIHYKTRARRQRRCLFMIVMALFLMFGGIGLFALADDGITSVKVTVSGGDTLWNLCEPYKPENMDIRDFIAKVKYVNHMNTSELIVGQEFWIPVR